MINVLEHIDLQIRRVILGIKETAEFCATLKGQSNQRAQPANDR